MEIKDIIKARRNEPWRADLRRAISNKERMTLPRREMRHSPLVMEVGQLYLEDKLVFSSEEALSEARRCLDCPTPGCVMACPAQIHIPSFIKQIERGNLGAAWQILRESSTLSGVCARVCPHDEQCEGGCIYAQSLKQPAVAIGALERYVADYEATHEEVCPPVVALPKNGKSIGIVGSGPAGLAAAHDLALLGYEIVVYESSTFTGGVMRSGIPRFRLPDATIDHEVERLRDYGVIFRLGCTVGKDIAMTELRQRHDAVFLGTGAGISNVMGVEGENLPGVILAGDYLLATNLANPHEAERQLAPLMAKRVAVIGGGNTAMDAARTAKRLGAERAIVVYRRSEAEMPACQEERNEAHDEGIEFMMLHMVRSYTAGEDGRVAWMNVERMELGEPDLGGRRKPLPTGEIVSVAVDLVVVCVGVLPDPLLTDLHPEIETSWGAQIKVDDCQSTSLENVYAGGDVARGGATVVLAMRDGRLAAKAIHARLSYGTDGNELV